ncbi:hypothetical protein EVAR_68802_1 [Eumeta japonica]|uniref:Uncharacterized protein n=1 Tax=Eumeta variegata TaxID=151549 RepID=A0A4C2AEN1_EUMVA|nr:hypothetical protein EVAR_68802_1 [Eumeta japonica]
MRYFTGDVAPQRRAGRTKEADVRPGGALGVYVRAQTDQVEWETSIRRALSRSVTHRYVTEHTFQRTERGKVTQPLSSFRPRPPLPAPSRRPPAIRRKHELGYIFAFESREVNILLDTPLEGFGAFGKFSFVLTREDGLPIYRVCVIDTNLLNYYYKAYIFVRITPEEERWSTTILGSNRVGKGALHAGERPQVRAVSSRRCAVTS